MMSGRCYAAVCDDIQADLFTTMPFVPTPACFGIQIESSSREVQQCTGIQADALVFALWLLGVLVAEVLCTGQIVF